MTEINTKLSSSASSWIYKDTDGIAGSTVFGTGSGDTHTFSGSLYVSGGIAVQNTGDTSFLPLPPVVAAVAFGADNFIAGESLALGVSGSVSIASTDFAGEFAGVTFFRNGPRPIDVSGKAYFDKNIYNSLETNTGTSITASADYSFLAVSSSGPTSILLPPAESRLELTIADVSGSAGTNTITINASGSNKIQGASSLQISTNFGAVTFFAYDSTNWQIKSTN